MFDHAKRERDEFGNSPGNGITPARLSKEPLASEGEATPGPDDYNPYEDPDNTDFGPAPAKMKENPTEGDDDPFVFDDVGDIVGDISLPGLEGGPRW